MTRTAETITVEFAIAMPERQLLLELSLAKGSTVADVIAHAAVDRQFPGLDLDTLAPGVWGRRVSREHVVSDGDRVELYRPLQIDPREARRELARDGRTMGYLRDDGNEA